MWWLRRQLQPPRKLKAFSGREGLSCLLIALALIGSLVVGGIAAVGLFILGVGALS